MKSFFLGIVLGVCIIPVSAYIFLIKGGMPVATKGSPLPGERFIAKIALRAAMENEIGKTSPFPVDEQGLTRGAKIYTVHCAVCHGLPSEKKTAIARGLFPKPPQLFDPDHGVTDDPIGKIYWKVKNGIRLTGMPGFVDSLSDQDLWLVSQVLLEADKLPTSVRAILTEKNR